MRIHDLNLLFPLICSYVLLLIAWLCLALFDRRPKFVLDFAGPVLSL